jgi:hypothetical protein
LRETRNKVCGFPATGLRVSRNSGVFSVGNAVVRLDPPEFVLAGDV